MKKTIIFCILLLMVIGANSQTWQWGRRAGSSWTLPYSDEEIPNDMTTDSKGNLYIISRVYINPTLSIDTTTITSNFVSNASNVLLYSYSCDGSLRWKKVIGTASGAYAKSVQTDSLGGVYVLAKIFTNGTPINVGNDTSFVNGNKQLYIIKFDTAGTFKWIRTPLSDTISFQNAFYNANPIDMHVDKSGNVTLFTEMPAGNNLNGALTLTAPAPYALRYNRFGVYISATPIPFKVSGLRATYRMSCFATVAPNGNFVFTGYRFYIPEDTVIAGIDTLKGRSFIVVSKPNGQLLWYKEPKVADTSMLPFSGSIFMARAAIDDENNIYVSGSAMPKDTLDGFVFVNAIQPTSGMPLVAKFNSSGNLQWAKVGSNDAIACAYGCSYRNNKIAITGLYSNSHMTFVGSSLYLGHQPNEGRDPFLAIFNASNGNLLALDSLHGLFGYDEIGYSITSDSKNNFFVSGSFDPYMVINGDALQTVGSKDVFIAKYGTSDCDFSSTVSIQENEDISNVIIYPNPTTGKLYIHYPLNNIEKVELYDLFGKCVLKIEVQESSNDLVIDVSRFPKALYLLQLTDRNNNRIGKKIVVQ